ncbi:hypothetical protein [Paenibacillus sp. DMB5]|uniref:hypothetical protein n=1 Tax=Paenibacillus sp. DMB5 TaxID=1780103 RepID=UPI00076CA5A1|nr:hypothetical protein [Paenibacillus sp. DMB5]KUP20508.1 hypothetical protein AWJ19_28010 [Paenibacillus sp. DMB5]
MKQLFIPALENFSLDDLRKIPKSDLHNHAGRGGNLKYIEASANITIQPHSGTFASLGEMQEWFVRSVKSHCPGIEGYLKRIEAAFVQAADDGIELLALSFGIDEIESLGGMDTFIRIMDTLRQRYAPQTAFLPELALDWACNTDAVHARLDDIFAYHWFRSIDICGPELAQPVSNFRSIYRTAKSAGLVLKAHTGEFGTADDVLEAAVELELQEVHHGIAAAASPQILHWLADHHIRLNVCPTSNVMLGRARDYASHPIRTLYDAGVPVTINTDDLLIFNQSVSEEYLNLYQCGLMSAVELNEIRECGLRSS